MDKTQPLIQALATIQNLPTLPAVLDTLRAAVKNPNADAKAIAAIIEDDPAMMTLILKVANSALYMGREPIHSLQHAISRLGLGAISHIAMSTGVFSTFPKTGRTDFDREAFWRHSISTGIAMVALHERCRSALAKRYTPDVLHLSGLLHDIGKIILDQFLHADLVSAVAYSRQRTIPLVQAETETFGSDHARLGAWLGMKWGLGYPFLETIRWHHDPESGNGEHRDLVMLCHCANHICNLKRLGDGGDTAAPECRQNVWQKLGLRHEDIPAVADEVIEKAKESEVLMTFD